MVDVLFSKYLVPIWFGLMVMFICNLIHFGDLLGAYNTIGAAVSAALFMFGFMMFLIEMFSGIARSVTQARSQTISAVKDEAP
ncbi:hypothetical protein [Pseudomonas sp. NPDC096950]|uniref:hypothetical protein n=1 Tax=Pseudomonas sp. NPDC096950 TaxID=3364485 RepID=UPI00383B42DC